MKSPWRSLVLLSLFPAAPALRGRDSRGWETWFYRGLVGVFALAALVAFNVPFYQARQAFQSLEQWDGVTLSRGGTVGELQQSVWMLRQEAQGVDWQAEALALAKQQALASGSPLAAQDLEKALLKKSSIPVVLSGAQEPWSAWVERGLVEEGFVLREPACERCVRLEWRAKEWVYRTPGLEGKPGEKEAQRIKEGLKRALVRAKRHGMEGVPAEPVRVQSMSLGADMKAVGGVWLDFCLHGVLAVLAWLLMWSSGYVGISWDRSRWRGCLEPWIMVHHPAWVLYGSKILRMASFNATIFLAVIVTAWAWGLPLRWPLVLALWLFVPLATVAVGLWGMLSTVLFHHNSGRLFSRILFSPMILLSAWFVRATVVWMAICATDPPRAYDWAHAFLTNGALIVWATLPGLVAVSWVLWRLVEWRMGSRGLGLRRSL